MLTSAGLRGGAANQDRMIGGMHQTRRMFPGVHTRSLIAPSPERLAQGVLGENLPDSARDIEDIFGIHKQSGFLEYLGQRRDIGGEHRCSVSHGFERGQSEAFIERRKEE